MGFPDLFKLEKLTIEAFSDRERDKPAGKPFEAMFNPTTISQTYGVRYLPSKAINNPTQTAKFEQVLPESLDLQLLFDGTGVDQIGLLTLFGNNLTVSERIETLLTLCYDVAGKIHEPNFLVVTWGQFLKAGNKGGFRGRLANLAITYQSFDRDGSPMRAQCDLKLVGDDAADRQKGALNLSSPDLTHSKQVRNGDTLPLLTSEIYGTSRHVAKVARANDLDQFRSLDPGRELLFPPIER